MGECKQIIVKVIPSKIGNEFIKKHHYSWKVVNNSNLHFGCFLDWDLHGVLSYWPSLDKSKMLWLVEWTGRNNFLELNRMAFDEYLPRNSESFCIAKTIMLIRKNAPQIKRIVSFADWCSCGDWTIYRASNFVLTGIKKNFNLVQLPNGEKIHKMTLESNPTTPRKELGGRSYYQITGWKFDFKKYIQAVNGKVLEWYQLRYLYFIDKSFKEKLTVPIIPFSKIDELGAWMYKWQKITVKERHHAGVV